MSIKIGSCITSFQKVPTEGVQAAESHRLLVAQFTIRKVDTAEDGECNGRKDMRKFLFRKLGISPGRTVILYITQLCNWIHSETVTTILWSAKQAHRLVTD